MDARDLLLDEHARMHAASVTGEKGTLAERTFGGLSDDQMRARPREDLNSLAWLCGTSPAPRTSSPTSS